MTRFELINHLIKSRNYKSYLEIGTQYGNCFKEINIEYKVCVDPVKCYDGLTHEMLSDDFFSQNTEKFDIVFVDGLHLEDQCTTDILNSIKCLNEGGTVVVHDCLPHCEDFIQVCWNGTCFRSIIDLRYNHPELKVFVVDTDHGCAVIQKTTPFPLGLYGKVPVDVAKTYDYYEQNKTELMNVFSVDQFLSATSK